MTQAGTLREKNKENRIMRAEPPEPKEGTFPYSRKGSGEER